ncbi:MAG: hypothetical protein PHI98_01285 [Eubacteriales bacterium]|nr:hypothetical protein [Eubacteriales bacterium]
MENNTDIKVNEPAVEEQDEALHLLHSFTAPHENVDADALEWAYNQGLKSRDFTVKTIGGDVYTNFSGLKRITPYEAEPAPCFEVFSLDGLCDWLNADVDGNIELYQHLFIHVRNERSVTVETRRSGLEQNKRYTLACCEFPLHRFPWGEYIDQERFVVMLLSRFANDPEGGRDAVGAFVGKIKQEQSAKTMDDGVTQKVAVKQGISMTTEVPVKNPVYLAPQRTFTEIEQPISPFVLRVQEGPSIALFEADDGAWKNVAVSRIAEYIRSRIHMGVSDKTTIIA